MLRTNPMSTKLEKIADSRAEITGYHIGAWLADTPSSAKGIKGAIWAADEKASEDQADTGAN
ncbi:hypothetical protein [Congregibacter sp.]|uniref:hypothetical protein n=1 Tax=Congregibacter sp. TaxID=2744308 RepID=UPI0039E2E820